MLSSSPPEGGMILQKSFCFVAESATASPSYWFYLQHKINKNIQTDNPMQQANSKHWRAELYLQEVKKPKASWIELYTFSTTPRWLAFLPQCYWFLLLQERPTSYLNLISAMITQRQQYFPAIRPFRKTSWFSNSRWKYPFNIPQVSYIVWSYAYKGIPIISGFVVILYLTPYLCQRA